ncbi:hypothetical protein M0R45_030341 [Rubus argutus]|uniref:Helicase SMUBP-2/HCS1 1B domain-containing protein n=1 Tax=Rubus argutus TaxID=59490 RepID=A0AAW1WAD8_RUBAR
METWKTKQKSQSISLEQFISTTAPLIDLEKEAEISASISTGATRNLDTAQKRGSAILNLKCVDAQTGLMGKTLLEFQSTKKDDVLPPHKVNNPSFPLCYLNLTSFGECYFSFCNV